MRALISSKHTKYLGYVLFAVILTAGLLYYRFPSDALRDYVQTSAENTNARVVLSVERIQPWPPVCLKFTGIELALKDKPDRTILKADRVLLKPRLRSLLRGKSEYSFHCLAYGGDLRGCAHFKKDSTGAFIDTEIELRDVHIGDYAYLSELIGRRVEGNLHGTISYTGPFKVLTDGSAEANLRLSGGRVELFQPLFTLGSLDFNEIEAEMFLDKQKINVTRLELKGEVLHGTLSGTITLKEKFARSSLDLRGTIEPFAAFFKGTAGIHDTVAFFKQRLKRGTLSFVIHGTLGEPKIKFT
ncbi:MAG: type II secretion system protein GspN [Desulfobacterales bacterium]|nr:type II secretion system protein GspN [Desulfobacterales bacterium]